LRLLPIARMFMNTKKIKIIFNPNAGKLHALQDTIDFITGENLHSNTCNLHPDQCLYSLVNCLKRKGYSCEMDICRSYFEAKACAVRCAEEKYLLVIAAGGDGTVNSVINGIAESSTALGILPTGSSNISIRQSALPHSVKSICDLLDKPYFKQVDLGKIDGRYFINMTGIGIKEYMPRRNRLSIFEFLKYFITGFENIFSYPFRKILLKIDNLDRIYKGHLAFIGNGKYYGSSIPFAFKAQMDDGLLDVIIFKTANPVRIIQIVYQLKNKGHSVYKGFEYIQAEKIFIRGPAKHPVLVDGESFHPTPAEISVVPRGLKIIC
jgi:diacylglycerol kinase (ATP)